MTNFKEWIMNRRLLPFASLLVIYIFLILWFDGPLKGDEFRYIAYAENLTEGFYTDRINPDLSNGPAYPLVLVPFVALNIDFIAAKILNGVFVFIGILFFYRTLRYYTNPKLSLLIAMALGLYPPIVWWMLNLYSEALAFMLINGLLFYFCSLFQSKKKHWKINVLASLCLGLLILTKVVFFQVLVLSALLLAIFVFFKKKYQFLLLTLFGAFIVVAPFIIYAYSVTNKFFYLGTRGGEILYHRSTPFEEEHGNWISPTVILGTENKEVSGIPSQGLAKLRYNHQEFYLRLEPLSNIQRDSAFKAKAIKNIKSHPTKYLKNTVSNVGRLFFNYPNSYRPLEKGVYVYFLSNGLLIVLFILGVYYMIKHKKKVPVEIIMGLIFAFIYGGGIIILHGKPRYFIMMVPSILLTLAYFLGVIVKIKRKKAKL